MKTSKRVENRKVGGHFLSDKEIEGISGGKNGKLAKPIKLKKKDGIAV